MSLLLVGLPETLAVKLVQRLVEEMDEVRLLLPDGAKQDPWKQLGAYVATGDPLDEDLMERAATNVRTLVLGDRLANLPPDETLSVVRAARRAGVGRVVVCQTAPHKALPDALREEAVEFVVLTTGKKPIVGKPRTKIPISKLSEAIDAADDISERVQAELDLTIPKAWKVLKVSPPIEREGLRKK